MEKILMSLKEVCEYTDWGETKVREILKRPTSKFTVILGNRLYVNKKKFDDYLVNFLIKEIDSTWEREGVEFEFKVYECLKQILDNDEIIACEALKEYLQEKWYEIHRECAWYDSHKSSKNDYYGYWSFEAGAIAKILNLDDSSLKDVAYYPYDLVHYKK